MPEPSNKELYEKVKNEIYALYPKHSAYRSGLIVQAYKKLGGTYTGKKNTSTGLNLWFGSKWLNQRGEVGYKFKSDIYRPTIKIHENTPATFSELSKKEIKRARREKARTSKVKQFKN